MLRRAQVATAIRGSIILAKMTCIPIRRGYWGNKIGKVHTVPTKLTGKCGSVTIRLVPAPRGAGIVAARTPKKVLQMAGIEDCYTCSRGSTKTLGNFVKACFDALSKSYGFLTPELWRETKYSKTPFQEVSGAAGAGGKGGTGTNAWVGFGICSKWSIGWRAAAPIRAAREVSKRRWQMQLWLMQMLLEADNWFHPGTTADGALEGTHRAAACSVHC